MDVRGKRVLIFGDSLTHRGAREAPDGVDVTESTHRTSSSPGDLLASHLLAVGARTARINGRVSRSAWNLFRVEDGRGILRDESARDPDLVFVFLGTNDLGLSADKDAEAFAAIRQAFELEGAEVWAIGPPTFADGEMTAHARIVYRTLAQVFGDRVIDLRPLTADVPRTSDGVHFTSTGASITAARLAAAIAQAGGVAARSPAPRFLPVGVSLGVAAGVLALAWVVRRRRRAR